MSGFACYFIGVERPAWRTLLADAGVENVGLSYWGVCKRKRKDYSLDWGFERVFLDSGGYTANSKPGMCTQREWRAYGAGYAEFAQAHLDELDTVTEFDCLSLGPEWIEAQRRDVWDHIDPEKFLPIWHPEHGTPALEALGERYKRVGITQGHIAMPGLNITPYLNKLSSRGVGLHGLAMSRPDAIRHVKFSSVSSTSWLSPMKWGETILFSGGKLLRYPMKMKEQARTRHRGDFERAGFDVEKIMADDPMEVTRVSIWSWLQYEASIRGERVTQEPVNGSAQTQDTQQNGVAPYADAPRNYSVALRVREPEEMRTLPVFGFTDHEAMDTESNEMVRTRLPVISSKPMRVCNTCFVRTECPAFEENASCALEIPIEIRTPAQRKALMNGLVEMQAQRVGFMRYREELSGGYADPNLSLEFDRLLKTFQVQAELEDDREFFRMNVEARGKAGVLSRLFGKDAGDLANQLPTPLSKEATDMVVGRVIQGRAE